MMILKNKTLFWRGISKWTAKQKNDFATFDVAAKYESSKLKIML